VRSRNASQSFADGTAKKVQSVLSGDRCVGKNTFHEADCASVASAGSAVQLPKKCCIFSERGDFVDTLKRSG